MIQYILVIYVIFHENYTHKLLTIMVDLLSLKVKVNVMCMIILSPLEGWFFKSLMQWEICIYIGTSLRQMLHIIAPIIVIITILNISFL